MAEDQYKIVVKKDVAELKALEKELDNQRKKELEAEKTKNKILIEQEKAKTKSVELELKKQIALIQSNSKKEIESSRATLKQKEIDLKRETEIRRAELKKQQQDAKFKGQSTQLGSPVALAQMRAYLKTLDATSPSALRLRSQIDSLSSSIAKSGSTAGMSKFQLLEFGENLTAVSAGIFLVAQQIIGNISELVKLGAELEIVSQGFNEFSGSAEMGAKNLELLRKSTAGNLTDTSLMQYGNQFMALGFSIEETAKFMSIAEDASDKMKVSFEESLQGVMRFTQTGMKRGLLNSGIQFTEVRNKALELAGATEEVFNALSEEEQQLYRTRAMLMTYNNGMIETANKTKDVGDEIANMNVQWENTKANLGNSILKVISPAVNQLNKDFTETGKTSDDTNKKLEDLGNIFKLVAENGTPLGLALNVLDAGFKGLAGAIGFAKNETSNFIGIAESLKNTILDTFNAINKITGNTGRGVDYGTSYDVPRPPTKTGTSRSGSRGRTEQEVKEELDKIKKLEEDINKLKAERLDLAGKYGETSKVVFDIETEIYKLNKELYELQLPAWLQLKQTFKEISDLPLWQQIGENDSWFIDSEQLKETQILADNLATIFDGATDSVSAFFESLTRGDTNGFKNMLKSLANELLNFVEVQFIGANASSIFQAIFSLGTSEIANMPLRIAGLVALEALRGAVNGLYTGGSAQAGVPYLVGENSDGSINRTTELFIPNQSGTVVNSKDTRNILNSLGNQTVNNIYIGSNIDVIKFMKIGMNEYKSYKEGKKL